MAESRQPSSSKLVREVVALGKNTSKTAFPNPDREGCPDRTRLRAMARRDRRLTLTDLPISHVVSCSPCYREYMRFRRISILVRASKIVATSLAMIALVFLAVRLVRNGSTRQVESNTFKVQRVSPPPAAAAKQTPREAQLLPISVDLASFSPTRGDDTKDDSGNKVHFPQKPLRATFLLPLGMEPGEYVIQLQDSTGTVFVERHAKGRMNAGTTSVEVEIDLTGASRGTFALLIQPPGLSWRRFPVIVE
jgi:hypothetical protein